MSFPANRGPCKDGELYYPGDQGDDWVCDCKPGTEKILLIRRACNIFFRILVVDMLIMIYFNPCAGYVFYPPRSQCFAAYKKGPCGPRHYLVLPKSSVIPECVPNPCIHDNHVNFRGNCYELNKAGPCPVPELMNVIGVNETTLEIICTLGFTADEVFSTPTRFGGSTEKPSNQSTPFNNNETTTASEPAPETFFFDRKECFKGSKRWTNEQCPQQNEQKNIDEIFGKF